MAAHRSEITQLLNEWTDGRPEALDKLMPLVVNHLRRIAQNHMRQEAADHTLQPTALVNETYLWLVGRQQVQWKNRVHFFASLGGQMRRILVDYARRKGREKRGGPALTLSLDAVVEEPSPARPDLVALDDALKALATLDRRQAEIVEMRFFAGLTLEEIGTVLGVSAKTVQRDWRTAKLWLFRELDPN